MAYVAVDGDTAEERCIWLTSIWPLKEHPNSAKNNKNHISVQCDDFRQLLTDVTTLADGLNEIHAKLEALDVN